MMTLKSTVKCQTAERFQNGIFYDADEALDRIKRCYLEGKMNEMLKEAFYMGVSGSLLSDNIVSEISAVFKEVVPDYPSPSLIVDFSLLVPLADRIWHFAMQSADAAIQDKVGASIYRCYEHNRMFDKARVVLEKLIDFARREKCRVNEAVMLNNYAFEYLLEERWQEAIPHFERAAEQFKSCGNKFEWANARANYWTCRLEANGPKALDDCEAELPEIEAIFSNSTGWRLRKTLVLRARIDEYRGQMVSAADWVKMAIEAAKNSYMRYPEIDLAYLDRLKDKMKNTSK